MLRHPSEVKHNHAGSNVYHKVDGIDIRISQCIYRKGVGVFLVISRFDDAELSSQVKPYLEALKSALAKGKSKNETDLSKSGEVYLDIDPKDRTNWDRMADWLHDRRVIFEKVLSDTKA